MRPGSTIARYIDRRWAWTCTADTSEATRATLDLAAAITGVIRRCKTPTFARTPLNANAAITNRIASDVAGQTATRGELINRRSSRVQPIAVRQREPDALN